MMSFTSSVHSVGEASRLEARGLAAGGEAAQSLMSLLGKPAFLIVQLPLA